MKQQTLDQRLSAYAVAVESRDTPSCKLLFAASAIAGMGAILIPPPAEAAIVYSGVQNKEVKAGGDTQTVDFNVDGNPEFIFSLYSYSSYFSQVLIVTGTEAEVIKNFGDPVNLPGNYTISSQKNFSSVSSDNLAADNPSAPGNFLNTKGFLGVKFILGSDTHYGWIQFQTNGNASEGTIIDWAYENTPRKEIKAGEKNFNWNLFLPAITLGSRNK
ncbi:MAG: hypothetical protein U9R57_15270 [Thermodesulfobacteriota bacterium]|nr:hypothetical protein [Thermodesulfobacteriota bacterium]